MHFLLTVPDLGSMPKGNISLHPCPVFLNECHPNGIATQILQWNSSHADSAMWQSLKLSPLASNSAPEGSLEFNFINHTGTVIFLLLLSFFHLRACTHTHSHSLTLHPSLSIALKSRFALTIPAHEQRATQHHSAYRWVLCFKPIYSHLQW